MNAWIVGTLAVLNIRGNIEANKGVYSTCLALVYSVNHVQISTPPQLISTAGCLGVVKLSL